jgi:hypothetical protein
MYFDDSAQGAVVTVAGVVSVAKTNNLMGKTLTPGTELYVDLPDPRSILSRIHTFTGRVENRFPFEIVTDRPNPDYYAELGKAFLTPGANPAAMPNDLNTAIGQITLGMHMIMEPKNEITGPKKMVKALTTIQAAIQGPEKSALGRMISGFSTLVDDSNRFRLGTVIEDRGTHLSIVLCPRTTA